MKALYLYCIRAGSGNSFDATGAIEDSPVFGIPFKDLEAVVSEIDLEKMSEAEISEKAKEDARWITQEAQKHQQVLDAAMNSASGAIIPMHFGTIFKSKKSLEVMLEDRFSSFISILKKLEGKEEWGVKVYVHEDSFRENLKSNPILNNQAQKVEKAAMGLDYFEELELDEMANGVMEQELDGRSDEFFDVLQQSAVDARKTRPLNREFLKAVAGGEEKDMMILNSSYLLESTMIDEFLRVVSDLTGKNKDFRFECTGPWPAYNFV